MPTCFPRFALLILLAFALTGVRADAKEHVILLHGLARTKHSMAPMGAALARAGYGVTNFGYPSTTASIEALSDAAMAEALAESRRLGATRIHFVTHSLGGILVRNYLSRHAVPDLGRVVMLAPPNQGSELVDQMGDWTLFQLIHGPAGNELGTGLDATPLRLGSAAFCVGIIAGHRSINLINSALIPGPDDGKVAVAKTSLVGMTDHLLIPATHTFMMRNRTAQDQTVHFLRHGAFFRSAQLPAGY